MNTTNYIKLNGGRVADMLFFCDARTEDTQLDKARKAQRQFGGTLSSWEPISGVKVIGHTAESPRFLRAAE